MTVLPVLLLAGILGFRESYSSAPNVEDAFSAAQAMVGMKAGRTELQDLASLSRLGSLHEAAASRRGPPGRPGLPIDCGTKPALCAAPFFCDRPRRPQTTVARDGHPDWSSWCTTPYGKAAVECARSNLSGYATLMHEKQLSMKLGPVNVGRVIEGIDAHYCFAFGHCDNREVTPATTIGEAEAMCDRRFGRAWRTDTLQDLGIGPFSFRMGLSGVHLSAGAERGFAKMACAMGNYHCDAIYCQENYCRKPQFVKKLGVLRAKATAAVVH